MLLYFEYSFLDVNISVLYSLYMVYEFSYTMVKLNE